MITSPEIRERFLSFFEAKGHTRVPSDSLIPSGDPTVLFTSAGMNQFKDCFLGRRADLRRAASCQKCLRTGDLDKVGRSPGHHSFFEMLGNFSFGDYFKAEAIQWGWEFLTGGLDYAGERRSPHEDRCLKLSPSKLWVSVYEDDPEAANLWRRLGMPPDRIRPFGQAENFWPANAPTEGPNGPCGPCSEIYYDPDGAVRGTASVEVWNLVFTQYDRQSDGRLAPLPRPNIDTGMGLERLTAVLQRVPTDYETDLFQHVMSYITTEMVRSKTIGPAQQAVIRAIADHVRAITFLIADGVVPSNEGRGYVLRMLIRRMYRHGLVVAGLDVARVDPSRESFLAQLTGLAIMDMAKSPYEQELFAKQDYIDTVVREEERQFARTLELGTQKLNELIERLRAGGQATIPGEEAFRLYDTYGFPWELTADVAQERGFTVERAGFERAMSGQQERSRATSQFGERVFVSDPLRVRESVKGLPSKEEQFVGYDGVQADGVIKGLWDGAAWATTVSAGQAVGVVLDRSPFYGESGGQAGDAGTIDGPKGTAEVSQTAWIDEVLVHHATIRQGTLSVQETVRARVNPERRVKVARSHTAAHLLHWALRKVLGPETVQAGSFVEAERVRFDFSSMQGLQEEQRRQVETLVNDRVRLSDAVTASQMALEEAKRSGALALFGEKYGSRVRVVAIGDYSKELCGGTHVHHTGHVGSFLIMGESSIAAGTRRIEALVGEAASRQQLAGQRILHEAARRLRRPAHDVVAGLEELLEQVKRAERGRKALQQELAKIQAERLVAEGKMVNGVRFVTSTIKRADREQLATLADAVRNALQREGVVLLASSDGPSQVSLVMATTSDLVTRVHAGDVIKAIAPLAKGTGGGRPEFAQAGGKDPAGVPAALKRAEELLRSALASS